MGRERPAGPSPTPPSGLLRSGSADPNFPGRGGGDAGSRGARVHAARSADPASPRTGAERESGAAGRAPSRPGRGSPRRRPRGVRPARAGRPSRSGARSPGRRSPCAGGRHPRGNKVTFRRRGPAHARTRGPGTAQPRAPPAARPPGPAGRSPQCRPAAAPRPPARRPQCRPAARSPGAAYLREAERGVHRSERGPPASGCGTPAPRSHRRLRGRPAPRHAPNFNPARAYSALGMSAAGR